MKTVMVIGSNSFTGSHVAAALLESSENRVIGVSRSPEYKDFFLAYKGYGPERFHFFQINLVNQFQVLAELIQDVKPEVVVNVAALSEVALSNHQPVEYFETNTLGTVRLVNFLRGCPFLRHYVHISSAEIFGSCSGPVSEETLFNPSTPYAVSKAAADMYLYTLMRHLDFPAILIRSTNVYGRYQQLFKIIPRTVIYLKIGKRVEIHGGGHAVKSFIHVRDMVRGLMLALNKGSSGTYHFSVPSEMTIAQVVRLICERMGRDFEEATSMVGERLGQDSRYWLDCSKARKELGWEPVIPFQQGVEEVMEWIDEYWWALQREPLEYIHRV